MPALPRPRLVPIKAPWQFDARGGRFVLIAAESPEEGPTVLHATAYILPEDRKESFELHHVKILFEDARASRLLPFDVSDLLAFDQSRSRPPEEVGENLAEIIRHGDAEWRRTGLNDSSGLHVVEPSTWLPQLMLDDEEALHHYYAFSRTCCIEVIARGWKWETVEVYPDAPPPMGPDGMKVTRRD